MDKKDDDNIDEERHGIRLRCNSGMNSAQLLRITTHIVTIQEYEQRIGTRNRAYRASCFSPSNTIQTLARKSTHDPSNTIPIPSRAC